MKITLYQAANGKRPYADWWENLRDLKTKFRIRDRVQRMEDGKFGDRKALAGGIYELKVHFGPGYRVYFGVEDKEVILLLCGGDKGSQAKDIKLAQIYWLEWQHRKRNIKK